MNGNNQWIFWVIGAGVLLYLLAQTNATTAANTNQTGVPAGSKVVGSTVYNAQGQVIGSVTSSGYYYPTLGSSGVPAGTTNPLTGQTLTAATVQNPLEAAPPGTTPGSGCQYNSSGQLLYCA